MDAVLFSTNNLKNSRFYRDEALSPYWHLSKADSTDLSVGRADDCIVISKFDRNP